MENSLIPTVEQKHDAEDGSDDLLKVLVADDQAFVVRTVTKMLYDLGYFKVIDVAEDGEAAWSKMSQRSTDQYDVVIMDIYMPRLDGLGLIGRCRKSTVARDVSFMVVTGETNPELLAALGEMGVIECLVKPFSFKVFMDRINVLLQTLTDPVQKSYNQISHLIEGGDYVEALKSLERLDKKESLKPKWLNLKGEIYLGMGFLNHARECIEQALTSCDSYLTALCNQAKLEEKAGNLAAAVASLEKADSISPLMVDRKIALGDLLFQVDREEDGKKMLLKAGVMSQDVEVKLQVSEMLTERGCEKEADKIISRILSFKFSGIETCNKIGISLRKQAKYREAEKSYMSALNYHPDNAAIYYNMGVLFLYEAKKVRATDCFKKALKLNPEFARAQAMLNCYCAAGADKAMPAAMACPGEVYELAF
jgi:CheY-like chemotaxis protein